MSIKDYVTRRRDFAKTRADQCKTAHGPTPNQTHNYFGGQSLGYWEGRAAALDDILGELEDGQFEEIMILKAEVERLRSVLERFDDRKYAMMPRSQMARIAKAALDASPSEYVDVTESHRWLKALVSALDDRRIQQTRLSSGTDFVIHCAREHVRKLDTEVPADATR